ncbi:MAG: thiamine phosphate synthase [Alphaproteobacteria bacterium]
MALNACKDVDLSVYFVADPHACGGRDIAEIVIQAIQGGVTMVQYRNKVDGKPLIAAQAAMLAELIKPFDVPFLVNDHVDIARDVDADGAHIGQGDIDPAEARRILGADKILGLTAFTQEHIENVCKLNDCSIRKNEQSHPISILPPAGGGSSHRAGGGANDMQSAFTIDYIGTGPFFPTKTDKGKPVLGAEKFAQLVKLSPVPVVGIGGITPENAAAVLRAGANGVAMMRAISEAENPKHAASEFAKTVKSFTLMA